MRVDICVILNIHAFKNFFFNSSWIFKGYKKFPGCSCFSLVMNFFWQLVNSHTNFEINILELIFCKDKSLTRKGKFGVDNFIII